MADLHDTYEGLIYAETYGAEVTATLRARWSGTWTGYHGIFGPSASYQTMTARQGNPRQPRRSGCGWTPNHYYPRNAPSRQIPRRWTWGGRARG